jgi:hypothetical protein
MLLARANADCARLERTLARLNQGQHPGREADLAAVRQRIADLAFRLS